MLSRCWSCQNRDVTGHSNGPRRLVGAFCIWCNFLVGERRAQLHRIVQTQKITAVSWSNEQARESVEACDQHCHHGPEIGIPAICLCFGADLGIRGRTRLKKAERISE